MLKGLLNMLRVSFIDGLVLEGKNFKDIVLKLREESFSPGKNVNEFMKETQRRAKLQTEEPIFYSDAETFIKELKRVNLVTAIEEF